MRRCASWSAGSSTGPSRLRLEAERGFLAELGGDCDLPAAAYATVDGDEVTLDGLIASLDGHTLLRHRGRVGAGGRRAHEANGSVEALGREVARYLLDDAGGAALLDR